MQILCFIRSVDRNDFKYGRRAEIFGAAKPAEYIYQVVAGAVSTHKLLSDGRRQIVAFHLPGDFLGLESIVTHRFAVEAVTSTIVHVAKRKNVDHVARSDPSMLWIILDETGRNLAHVENHLLLLGRKNSLERVAAFLLEMRLRSIEAGVIHLPMSRHDIADYLGLSLETVSRGFSDLHRRDILRFDDNKQRKVVILDVKGLAELAKERLRGPAPA